jgi:hypothetical protein
VQAAAEITAAPAAKYDLKNVIVSFPPVSISVSARAAKSAEKSFFLQPPRPSFSQLPVAAVTSGSGTRYRGSVRIVVRHIEMSGPCPAVAPKLRRGISCRTGRLARGSASTGQVTALIVCDRAISPVVPALLCFVSPNLAPLGCTCSSGLSLEKAPTAFGRRRGQAGWCIRETALRSAAMGM